MSLKTNTTPTAYERAQTEIRDQYGALIERGSIITYPVRKGSNMWMRTAVVESIKANNRTRTISAIAINEDGSTRGVSINPLSAYRITVLPEYIFPSGRNEERRAMLLLLSILKEDEN